MPSWNMQIAHAERLLKGGGSVARAGRDGHAFLFGNLIPDIYVGYMVPGVVRPVPSRVTHFAKPEHIPKPRAGEFFDAYVLPLARECGLLDALGDDRATGGGVGAPGFASGASGFVGADSDRAPVGPTGSAAAGDPAPERSWRAPASLAAEVVHVSPAHTPTFEWDFDVAETAACQRDAFATSRRALSRDELRRSLFDMVLGTWVHLLADCTWNQAVETAACQRDAFATSRRALSRDELRRSLFDMVLGTWVHLLADCTWNQAVSVCDLPTRAEPR